MLFPLWFGDWIFGSQQFCLPCCLLCIEMRMFTTCHFIRVFFSLITNELFMHAALQCYECESLCFRDTMKVIPIHVHLSSHAHDSVVHISRPLSMFHGHFVSTNCVSFFHLDSFVVSSRACTLMSMWTNCWWNTFFGVMFFECEMRFSHFLNFFFCNKMVLLLSFLGVFWIPFSLTGFNQA